MHAPLGFRPEHARMPPRPYGRGVLVTAALGAAYLEVLTPRAINGPLATPISRRQPRSQRGLTEAGQPRLGEGPATSAGGPCVRADCGHAAGRLTRVFYKSEKPFRFAPRGIERAVFRQIQSMSRGCQRVRDSARSLPRRIVLRRQVCTPLGQSGSRVLGACRGRLQTGREAAPNAVESIVQLCAYRSRKAFAITLTDDSAIAAAAMIGDSRIPKKG